MTEHQLKNALVLTYRDELLHDPAATARNGFAGLVESYQDLLNKSWHIFDRQLKRRLVREMRRPVRERSLLQANRVLQLNRGSIIVARVCRRANVTQVRYLLRAKNKIEFLFRLCRLAVLEGLLW